MTAAFKVDAKKAIQKYLEKRKEDFVTADALDLFDDLTDEVECAIEFGMQWAYTYLRKKCEKSGQNWFDKEVSEINREREMADKSIRPNPTVPNSKNKM